MRDRSGGSATYVREDGAAACEKAPVENPPKEPENAPKPPAAARLLDAWDLNFLLIVWGSMISGEFVDCE